MLPRDILERLDVKKLDRVTFQLAGERTVEYDVGQVAMPLLGAATLELFNMAADPVRRRLISVPGLLK